MAISDCQYGKRLHVMGRVHISKAKLKAALIKHNGFVAHAARAVGIHRNTLHKYFHRWPDLKDVHLNEVYLREDDIVCAQYDLACGAKMTDDEGNTYTAKPDTTAAKLVLTFLHGYSDRQENHNLKYKDKLVETFKDTAQGGAFTPINDVDDEVE